MNTDPPTDPSADRLMTVWILTCTGSTILAGVLGVLASVLYTAIPPARADGANDLVAAVGGYGGLGLGLLAGVGWCWLMTRRHRSDPPVNGRRYGGWCGVGVGAAATVVLHLTLMAVSGVWAPGGLATGLAFGLPAGATLGVLCAFMFPRSPALIGEHPPTADPGAQP